MENELRNGNGNGNGNGREKRGISLGLEGQLKKITFVAPTMSPSPTTTSNNSQTETKQLVRRVKLHGFTLREQPDTDSHQVEIGTIVVNEKTLVLEMIRSKKRLNGNFLIAKIYNEAEKVMWDFRDFRGENENFRGICQLTFCENQYLLVFIGSIFADNGERIEFVKEVMPIVEAIENAFAGQRITSSSMIQLKIDVARYMRLECRFSNEEKYFLATIGKRKIAKAKERAEQRQQTRQIRKEKITQRPQISAIGFDGGIYRGTPVTEKEWPTLPDGQKAISVSDVDPESGLPEGPIEAFIVKKRPGSAPYQVNRRQIADFCDRKTTSRSSLSPKKVEVKKTIIFEVEDESFEEIRIVTKEDFDKLQADGLNNGTRIALDQTDEKGRYQVLEFSEGGEVKTIGAFAPIE